jgi:hypothetical protein
MSPTSYQTALPRNQEEIVLTKLTKSNPQISKIPYQSVPILAIPEQKTCSLETGPQRIGTNHYADGRHLREPTH